MLRTTPPASVLCRMSADKTLATTGNRIFAGFAESRRIADEAVEMPSAPKTVHESVSFSRLPSSEAKLVFNAARRAGSGADTSVGAVQCDQAFIASAQD